MDLAVDDDEAVGSDKGSKAIRGEPPGDVDGLGIDEGRVDVVVFVAELFEQLIEDWSDLIAALEDLIFSRNNYYSVKGCFIFNGEYIIEFRSYGLCLDLAVDARVDVTCSPTSKWGTGSERNRE